MINHCHNWCIPRGIPGFNYAYRRVNWVLRLKNVQKDSWEVAGKSGKGSWTSAASSIQHWSTLPSTKDTIKEMTNDFYHIHRCFFTHRLVGTQNSEWVKSPPECCLHWSQTAKDTYTKSKHFFGTYEMTKGCERSWSQPCVPFAISLEGQRGTRMLKGAEDKSMHFTVSLPCEETQVGNGGNGKFQSL